MKINKALAHVICTIENIIGNQTYNPHSYNGWTGEEGCGYKYPVSYCKTKSDFNNHIATKTKDEIIYIDPECVETMKYVFGSNHLYIGDGIVDVLEFLEQRYGLNFNELEAKRNDRYVLDISNKKEKLEKGESITIPFGRTIVGVDFPEGEYQLTINSKHFSVIHTYDELGNPAGLIFNSDKFAFKNGYIIISDYDFELMKR